MSGFRFPVSVLSPGDAGLNVATVVHFKASFREGFLSSVMKGMPTVAKVGRMMGVVEADAFLPRHITGYRVGL